MICKLVFSEGKIITPAATRYDTYEIYIAPRIVNSTPKYLGDPLVCHSITGTTSRMRCITRKYGQTKQKQRDTIQ